MRKTMVALTVLVAICASPALANGRAQIEMLREVFRAQPPAWKGILAQHQDVLDKSFFSNCEKRIRWAIDTNHIDDALRFAMVADFAADVVGRPARYRLGLAEAFGRAGNNTMMREILDNILITDPHDDEAVWTVAELERHSQDYYHAIKHYKTCADDGYHQAQCYHWMGEMYLTIGKNKKGTDLLHQAADMGNQAARKTLARLAQLNTPVPQSPTPSQPSAQPSTSATGAKTFLQQAEALRTQGKLLQAEQDYLKAIDANPTSAEAYIDLGALCYRLGNLNSARQYLTRATQLAPHNFHAWHYLGNCYERLYDRQGGTQLLDQAVSAYQNGLQAAPTNKLLKMDLARVQAKLSGSAQN